MFTNRDKKELARTLATVTVFVVTVLLIGVFSTLLVTDPFAASILAGVLMGVLISAWWATGHAHKR